jgi:peptidoglycan hydrolase CwlO-like protein
MEDPKRTEPAPGGIRKAGSGANAPQPANSNQTILMIAAAVILALGGALIYVLISDSNRIEELEVNESQLTTEIQQLEARESELMLQLQELTSESTQDKAKIQELLKQIDDYKSEISKFKKQVNDMYAKGQLLTQERDDYMNKFKQLEFYNEKYRAQIENLELQLAQKDTVIKQLSTEMETQKSQNFDLTQENDLLKTKQKAASVHAALNFKFLALKKNNKTEEVEKGKLKRKHIDKAFRTCFNLAPNAFAPKGNTDVYLIIEGPGNSVYTNFTAGSGYFELNGKQAPYSAKGTASFSGEAVDMCIDYKVTAAEGMSKGNHKIFAYSNGFLIGSGNVLID